ncbi:siderophore-interacting protein [Shimia sp.]|uniref:siderophore-interacting protein n=1 Tax=Shimia sp. TaxID=1954381 RepID=UPI003BACAFB5
MTEQTLFPHVAETSLSGLAFAAVRALLMHEAEEHDLTLSTNTEKMVRMSTEYGDLSFQDIKGGVKAVAMSKRADTLFILKESLVESISHFAPELVETLVWSDASLHQGHPPNFQFATVKSVRAIGGDFMRVVLHVEDVRNFVDSAIHFRIILPAVGDNSPDWPTVNEKGVTVWPKGDKALHRPVYTVRRADIAAKELEFDVFLHAGGRTTEWAKAAVKGSKIGLTGPGGGGIPKTNRIAVYADETAFPAVARLLEGLPRDSTGKIVVMADGGEACGYIFPEHPRLKPEWVKRNACEGLAAQAITDRKDHADHMLWFASEKEDVAKVRAFCSGANIDTKQHYIATYWSR